MKTNSPKTTTKKKAIKPAKKAAKKGKAKSAVTGQFVKKDFAAKNKATTYLTKPKKKDTLREDIKNIFKFSTGVTDAYFKIKDLVYKK